jgi:hypothetical protein
MTLVAAIGVQLATTPASAQDFDPGWYAPTVPYVKLGVVEDGVYQVTGSDLTLAGVSTSSVDPSTLRLHENGVEIPLRLTGSAAGTLGPTDGIVFVGRRNTGEDEDYLYDGDRSRRSSTYHSLFTDTTFYWLSWGGIPGLRYTEAQPPTGSPRLVDRHDAVFRIENDVVYYPGDVTSSGNPLYTNREGYYHLRIAHGTNQNTITRSLDANLSSPTFSELDTLRIRVRLNSETSSKHNVQMSLRLDQGGAISFVPVDTVDWSGLSLVDLEASVPQSRIPGDANVAVQLVSRNDFGSSIPNNLFLDWIEISYRRNLATIDDQARLELGPGDARIAASGFASDSVTILAPGLREALRVAAQGGATAAEISLSAASDVWMSADNGLRRPARIVRDNSAMLASAQNGADYVVLTSAALRSSADEIAAYRSTVAGGSHATLVVDVQDVFDEFDYGRPTPIAIRRFVRASAGWATAPRFVAMWGDALYPLRTRPRPPWEVPSFGHTVSDGWFAMQNGGPRDWSESLAIGRIPIRSNDDGRIFLEKLVDYEAQPFADWQKSALYLVGGTSDGERRLLQSHSLKWSDLVSSDPTALDTTHYFKTSSDALDPTFKDSIQQSLREGASWLTYFGHSATQTWEIVTDPPAEFDNAGRLPVVLSLGCFTGDFATGKGAVDDIRSFSEQLVLDNLNGSIAHWGASASGTIGASANLSDEVHASVFTDTLRTLGTALQAAKRRINNRYSDGLTVKHLLQYGLIGDPATSISLPTKPDFVLSEPQIRVEPVSPIPADSSLRVSVTVRNLGLAPPDSVDLELTHGHPAGSADRFAERVEPFGREAQVLFRVPIRDSDVGVNTLRAIVDPGSEHEEEDELNNQAQVNQYVFSKGLAIVSPPVSGLVGTTSPLLRVTPASVEIIEQAVLFELDTLATYDSPGRQSYSTTQGESPAFDWQPPGLQDESTYYWRARIDDPANAEENWVEGSFTIRLSGDTEGWHQSGALFEANENSSFLDRESDAWVFKTFGVDASASSSRGSADTYKGQFVINGVFFERLGLGFGLLVIDGNTGIVKGSTAGPTYANDFEDPASAYRDLVSLAATVVPGDYVLARTRHKGNKNAEVVIPDTVKAIFSGLGSAAIDTLTYRHLWSMITRFGFPAETEEMVEPPGSGIDEFVQERRLSFFFGEGSTASPAIGPATDWETIKWAGQIANATGSIRVDVLTDGGSVLRSASGASGSISLDGVDPRQVPRIRLRATLSDSAQLATPQLIEWDVGYTGVPEVTLDARDFSLSADTLQEGQPLDVAVSAVNLGPVPSALVVADYTVIDASNRAVVVGADTVSNLTGSAALSQIIETRGLVGQNRLEVSIRQPDLEESTTTNNVVIRSFRVTRDDAPPDFDVTFDGEAFPHDPDPVVNLQDPALPFVSLRPMIEVYVSDENEYLPLREDTSTVELVLDGRTVPHSELSGFGKKDNELFVLYEPDLPEKDTTHTLQVVVRDVSGNESLESPYQVHFRTQTDVEIESVYPYPNPMSTSTVFAFRLRGADASEISRVAIRIYTINGRLIREFDLIDDPFALEAGALRIGWNKVVWDGRDEDGDAVATGVYLYKVFAESRGEDIPIGNASGVERIAVIR